MSFRDFLGFFCICIASIDYGAKVSCLDKIEIMSFNSNDSRSGVKEASSVQKLSSENMRKFDNSKGDAAFKTHWRTFDCIVSPIHVPHKAISWKKSLECILVAIFGNVSNTWFFFNVSRLIRSCFFFEPRKAILWTLPTYLKKKNKKKLNDGNLRGAVLLSNRYSTEAID